MNEDIPQLPDFNEPTLDAAFATLAEEARTADTTDVEAFRLHWLGRKQGRLKLISEAWLKSAPPEAKKALGIRFNQLKQQIEAALEAPAAAPKKSAVQGIDITLPGTVRAPGIPHPLLKTLHEIDPNLGTYGEMEKRPLTVSVDVLLLAISSLLTLA